MNPNDPNNPMYQGQSLQGQQPQVQVQASPLSGFHLLQGLGNLAAGIGYLFSGSKADDEEDVEEAPRRPRPFRPRVFGANASKRVGAAKPCCRRPVGK